MAIALVSHTSVAATSGGGTSGAINTTGSTLLVAVVAWTTGSAALAKVTDNQSNVWLQVAALDVDQSTNCIALWYVANPIVAASHTFTVTSGSPFMAVAAFSGTATTYPAAVAIKASTGGATSLQAGSITPATANNVVISGISYGDTTSLSVDSSFTITDQAVSSSGSHNGGALAYLIQTSAVAVNPKFSWTNSVVAAAVNANFHP